MKISNSDIQIFLNASYDNNMFDIGNKYIIDKKLSDERMKVYTIVDSNEVVTVHRGLENAHEWVDDVTYLRNHDIRNSNSYRFHLRRQMKVIHKYKAENIIIMGFDRGGVYAKQMFNDKLAKKFINTVLEEVNEVEPAKEPEEPKEIDIFEKKIDFKPICRNQLIDYIMKQKKIRNIEVNTTRLTKMQLVEIVKKLIG